MPAPSSGLSEPWRRVRAPMRCLRVAGRTRERSAVSHGLVCRVPRHADSGAFRDSNDAKPSGEPAECCSCDDHDRRCRHRIDAAGDAPWENSRFHHPAFVIFRISGRRDADLFEPRRSRETRFCRALTSSRSTTRGRCAQLEAVGTRRGSGSGRGIRACAEISAWSTEWRRPFPGSPAHVVQSRGRTRPGRWRVNCIDDRWLRSGSTPCRVFRIDTQ